MPTSHFFSCCRSLALSALTLWLAPVLAAGANAPTPAQAQQRYQQDMAACNSGQTGQTMAACRLEARNALQAARRGALNGSHDFEANALARCHVHEGLDRAACEARMRGDGEQEGSVEGGGILRQGVMVVPGS